MSRTIPQQVADTLKRKTGWYIDRDTKTISYRGPSDVALPMRDVYRRLMDEMDNSWEESDALDISDPLPIARGAIGYKYEMINGYSLSDDTIERITDPERLIK